MATATLLERKVGPKQRQKHYSYDENVDEAGTLIDNEQTEIEREVPADEREPVESPPEESRPGPPAFEE